VVLLYFCISYFKAPKPFPLVRVLGRLENLNYCSLALEDWWQLYEGEVAGSSFGVGGAAVFGPSGKRHLPNW